MYNLCILVLLSLLIGLVHSFDWDIVVGKSRQLEFYYNGALTHTEDIRSATQIHTISYDPVNYRVLLVDYTYPNVSISSFDLTTRKIQPLLMRDANGYYNARVVFEPVTQLFFWKKDPYIYSSKLSPASSDKVDETLLVKLDHVCLDIAVDSCGGYIYWITHHTIERARLNGSGREVLIEDKVYDRRSLTIDQQTQKIYWTEKVYSTDSVIFIKSANLDGKNITILYTVGNDIYATSLAVTKDFIYWQQFTDMGIFQLPKSPSQKKPRKLISTYISTCVYCRRVATNYRIEEQIQGIQNCEGVQYLISNNSKLEETVSICQDYCLQGNCSVSAEGKPICSCETGYSGEKCEVNACDNYCLNDGVCSFNEEGEPVCQCTTEYEGLKCDFYICQGYCDQGYCSFDAKGQPLCSCEDGYSGIRCNISACDNYCLNGGVCSLNEASEPVCQCSLKYEGLKCEFPSCEDNYCVHGNCSYGYDGPPICSCETGYSGVHCEVDMCHEHCLNGGVCSLNEEDEPFCECTAGYDGPRCEVAACKDNCGGTEGGTKLSCDANNSGEREVNPCHQYCLNDGVCSLDDKSEPVCQCPADYAGARCDVPAFLIKCFLYIYKNLSPVTLSKAAQATCASPDAPGIPDL